MNRTKVEVRNKPYRLIDGVYHPREIPSQGDSDSEFTGDYWRVWEEDSKWFLEHDIGHFATKMKVVEISEREYEELRSGATTPDEVASGKQGG